MKKKLSFIKDELALISLVTLSILIIFNVTLFNGDFLFNVDTQFEYNIFYKEWIRLIEEFLSGNGLPMYSWNSFLGDDFYSAYSVNTTGDVFLPLLLMFDDIKIGLLLESILCIFISAISMKLFLKESGIVDKRILLIFPLIYSISGCSILYVGQYMFCKVYAFFPLAIYGLERIINRKGSGTFIISIALLFFSCYYFMFHISIFILLYGLCSAINKSYKGKDLHYLLFKAIKYYLIGFMITGVISIPAIINLLGSPRVGDTVNLSLFWSPQTYLGLFSSAFLSGSTILSGLFYASENWHDYWYCLTIGLLPLIIGMSLIKEKKYRYHYILLAILLLFAFIRPLSSIMHGFSEPSLRWTHVLVFYFLYIAALGFDKCKVIQIKKTSIIYVLIFLLLMGVTITIKSISQFTSDYIDVLISLTVNIIIVYIFCKNKMLGMSFSIVYLIVVNTSFIYGLNKSILPDSNMFEQKILDNSIISDDEVIFRYYIDKDNYYPQNELNLNQSMNYGYMSTATYNSIYDYNIVEFLQLMDYGGWHAIDVNNPDVMTMLGVKYYMVYDESELPEELEFEYVYNINHMKVYRNLSYKGFGYSNKSIKHIKDIKDLSEFNNTTFVSDDIDLNQYKNLNENKFDIYEKGNNHLKGYIESNSNNILMIPIPNNKGWKVINNYQEVDTISVNGGFMGIPISEGDNHIEIYFMSYGFKIGCITTLIGLVSLIFVMISRKRNVLNRI